MKRALARACVLVAASACSHSDELSGPDFLEVRPLIASAVEAPLVPASEGTPEAASLSAMGRADLIERRDLSGICTPSVQGPRGLSGVYEEIVRLSNDTRIVVINEAHDVPEHRAFLEGLLPYLHEVGFTHLAMEAIAEGGLPSSKPVARVVSAGEIEQLGLYFGDPRLGRAAETAHRLDISLIQYDRLNLPTDDPNFRERVQADNLIAALETLPPETRLIIHAGHGHAAEEPFIVDESFSMNWFIAQVKERTGIDPLTVNLSNCGRAESVEYAFATPAFDELAAGFDLFVSMPRAEQRSLSLEAMKTLGLKLQELAEADVPTERSLIVVRDRACRACQPYDILLWEPDRGNKAVVFVPTRGRYQVDIVELME